MSAPLILCAAALLLPRGDGGEAGDFETEASRKPALHTGGALFVHDATLLTVSHGTIEHGDLLVVGGKIAALGRDLAAPDGVTQLDGRGLFVMPGLIDCHSHAAIDGGINEGTLSIVPEVRIRDEVDPRDVTLFQALAGGTTTMNLLHGSANVIGGQNAVVKLRYGRPAAELLFEGAPPGVKFALGENPKQSNGGPGRGAARRYPASRMGVEAALRRAFTRAGEYRDEWRRFADAKARGEEQLEPRRDQRLQALVDILEGKILVHSHCYRADEILMLLRVADEFGFKVRTLQHVLEGYKVAPEIAAHGAGPSTFSDWWAYKLEAYDAIPYNAALLELAGCRCSLNSDSADLTRRLYHEAAKTLRYGDLSEEKALAQVTLNPAWQLGIDGRVGSLDVGKDADLALFNGHPLSVYSRCEYTFVDGECCFERKYADGETRPLNETGPTFGPDAGPDPSRLPLPTDGGDVYALVGATIHPVSGPPIEAGVLVIDHGRIAAVGADVRVPDHAEVVRCEGLEIYPGLIDAATHLGLGEIGSVAGGNDQTEIGANQADLRVTASLNAASSHIPVTRCDGVTNALVVPEGNAISGRASLIQLDGWTWEQMVVGDSLALVLQFPAVSADEPPEKAFEKEEVKQLEALFDAAGRYADARAAARPGVARDLKLEALVPYLRGENGATPRLVLVAANARNQLRTAALFAEKHHLNALLLGCSEGWLVADFLKQHGARCLVANSLGLPGADQRYDAQFQNAARLHAAGVPFALVTLGKENVRQLGHHAGMAAAFGLPRDEALKSVTLRPAQLLGVADRFGSLEAGKSANVIVTDGDPLELRTHVRFEFIAGRPVRLVSKQTELYEQYKRRILEARATRAAPSAASAGGP